MRLTTQRSPSRCQTICHWHAEPAAGEDAGDAPAVARFEPRRQPGHRFGLVGAGSRRVHPTQRPAFEGVSAIGPPGEVEHLFAAGEHRIARRHFEGHVLGQHRAEPVFVQRADRRVGQLPGRIEQSLAGGGHGSLDQRRDAGQDGEDQRRRAHRLAPSTQRVEAQHQRQAAQQRHRRPPLLEQQAIQQRNSRPMIHVQAPPCGSPIM